MTYLAKDAAELRKATKLETWLAANPDMWDYCRSRGWFVETITRLEAAAAPTSPEAKP